MQQNNNLPETQKNQETGLLKSTKETFLKGYAVHEVVKNCSSINTTLKAIDSNLPTIARVKKEFGFDFIQAYIEGWIVNFVKYVNVGKNMSDEQIFETAIFICTEFYMLNIADINLIFKKAKMGVYGQFYDRLDGMVIIGFFEKYYNERCSNASDREINQSYKYKDDNLPSFDKIVKLAEKRGFK